MTKIYSKNLEDLIKLADKIPNTRMMAIAKISALVALNMRYERIMVDRNLDVDPNELVSGYISDATLELSGVQEISYIEASSDRLIRDEGTDEEKHKKLFQKLWVRFSLDEYKERVERYLYRLKVNKMSNGWLKGFKCIDFGCGHGNFAHALIKEGAEYVYAVDCGHDNIEYAIKARESLRVSSEKIEFKEETVNSVSKPDGFFDFAVQNGVFHHLENEDEAYKEVYRVLKPGGWFWVYTDGFGSISSDLWDASVYILREIPQEFILSYLDFINVETGKKYHLGDGLNAVYRHHTWDGIIEKLTGIGFGNFRRLVGGFSTDFDHDVISKDKYGKEKFGEGDIRILAQKVRTN